MRREAKGLVLAGGPSASPGAAATSRMLDACLEAVEVVRSGEARLLDAMVALRTEVGHQLATGDGFGVNGWRPSSLEVEVDIATVDEFACASGLSRAYTIGVVRLAGADRARLERARAAIGEERVELRRVVQWHEACEAMREDDALAVADSVFSLRRDGTPRSASDFRRLLGKRVRQVEARDRQARQARAATALAERGAWVNPRDDGTGSLAVVGEATRVAAAWGRVDAAARRARARGDERSLAQLRSDVLLDLLLVGQLPGQFRPVAGTSGPAVGEPCPVVGESGAAPGQSHPVMPEAAEVEAVCQPPVCTSCGAVSQDFLPLPLAGEPVLPPARCTVVVGLDVLLESAVAGSGTAGADDEGPRGASLGWMPGFGYLDPDHVREVAVREGSVWQRLVADPVTGHAVAVSPHTYRPTQSVARFVRARDGAARDPGSGSFGATPAESCEIDHVVPFADGGGTVPENLQCLSRRGHARKTKRQWTVRGDAGGTLTWTSLAGRRYASEPLDHRDA